MLEPLLAALADTGVASALRDGRWTYAALSAAHILGIAMLVGAVIPLSARLLGGFARIPLDLLVRVLVPAAVGGLVLALATGALLFATRAPEYAGLTVFRIKLALVALGMASALLAHRRAGIGLERAGAVTRTRLAITSLTCWLGALACGRLIAFVGD